MDNDEMKQLWTQLQACEARIEGHLQSESARRGRHAVRGALRWSLAAGWLELVVWIAFTALAATFWVQHRGELRWLAIGLVLHAYGIAGIWACATRLLLTTRIHLFDAPVTIQQRRLSELRRFQVCSTLALGLPWWCLWLPVALAIARQWGGVDGFAAGSNWFWVTMSVGVVGMLWSLWLARRVAARQRRSPFWQRIVDDLSGRSLARATREMEAVAAFARE